MNNDDENKTNRYFDFSEDEDVIEGFSPGSYQKKWLEVLAKQLQKSLRRKNPMTAIKELLAFGFLTQAWQMRNIQKLLLVILIINVVLLGIVVYLVEKV